MIDTKALREKVLDLAIRGKLVPQDPNDEPASVLLKKIREQKKQMVKEGKLKAKDIKKDTVIFKGDDNLHYEQFADGTVKCIEDEIPFELPKGWAWSRFKSFCYPISDGTHQTPTYTKNGYTFLSAKNVTSWKIDWDNVMYIPEELHIKLSKRIKPQKGDILLAKNGTIGVAAIVDKEFDFDIYVTLALIRTVNNSINSQYLLNTIASSTVQSAFRNSLIGIGVQNLHLKHIREVLIPIAPHNEQERITDKVLSLLPLLETIETNKTNLYSLIKTTKAKVLDLAIQGKLVPQNPDDEPASVLLDRIRAEKEELIKSGKIKRDKKESVIFKGDDNSYYDDIPDNWAECSILSIAEVELGKTLDKAKNTGTYYPYLRSVNIKWDDVDLTDVKEMKFEENELTRYSVKKNDLLICEGGDVGRCCIWNSEQDIYYQNALHRVRFYGNCHPKYFLYIMMYLESIGYLKRISNGVTIKHLTKNVLASIPFLLPPLAEQQRIVEAIEDIFSKLDAITDNIS